MIPVGRHPAANGRAARRVDAGAGAATIRLARGLRKQFQALQMNFWPTVMLDEVMI